MHVSCTQICINGFQNIIFIAIGRVTTPDDVTHEFILRNADGRPSSRDHKELPLYVSNNADHPKENGWQMFDYAGVRFYLNANDGHACYMWG